MESSELETLKNKIEILKSNYNALEEYCEREQAINEKSEDLLEKKLAIAVEALKFVSMPLTTERTHFGSCDKLVATIIADTECAKNALEKIEAMK